MLRKLPKKTKPFKFLHTVWRMITSDNHILVLALSKINKTWTIFYGEKKSDNIFPLEVCHASFDWSGGFEGEDSEQHMLDSVNEVVPICIDGAITSRVPSGRTIKVQQKIEIKTSDPETIDLALKWLELTAITSTDVIFDDACVTAFKKKLTELN